MFDHPENEKARNFINDMLGGPKPDAAPALDPAAPAEPSKPVVATADGAPAEPPSAEAPIEPVAAKPTVKKLAKRLDVDYERVAEVTAEAVAREMLKVQQPAVAPVAAETALPEAEQRRLRYLAQLEKLYPDKYKDVTGRYETSFRTVSKYQKDWETEHPGEEFDAEDSEHEDFYKTHAVDWEDDDYAEAVAESKLEKMRQEADQREASRERKHAVEPDARKAARATAEHVISSVAAELKELATSMGDDFTVDPAVYTRLEEADPVKAPIMARAAETAARFTSETTKLFRGAVDYDANNSLHRKISAFALSKEKQLLALPKDQQLDATGRKFLSSVDFHALDARKREGHWTLKEEDVSYLASQEIAREARKTFEAEESKLQRVMTKRGVVPQKVDAAAPAAPAAPIVPEPPKPVSPSGGLDPKMSGSKGAPTDERTVRWNSFRNSLLGVK